ncbi:hypothetical protein ABB55_28230 [Prosthecomicrobium hirschii]|uniref:Uncharacterized protein n=1 Tax=Prosthecodimorpha hirschii TaxID=665126 RepID=A0A0P6VFF6_9HYPH|nr:hypothetical protein ABB55_28230 [Prosthecomicrobium hirschii]
MFVMKPQHSFALVGGQKDDASGFQCPPDLIARRLIHIKPAFGFEAFESGQRYSGLVSERLLRPTQQRACGP